MNVGSSRRRNGALSPISSQAFRCAAAFVEVYVIRIMMTRIELIAETGVGNAKNAIFEGLFSAHSHAL
jgi:hypothetical protein